MSTSVNRQARKQRHQKALQEIWSLVHHEKREKPQIVQKPSFGKIFKVQAALVSMFCMVVSSFLFPNMSLWTNVEGGFIGFEDDTLAFLGEESGENLMIASDDGFLEKPTLQTETGDRTVLNDVSQYTVKDGDSVYSIAREFGIDAQTIIDVNNIANASRLRAGTVLQILPVSGVLHKMDKDATIAEVAKKYRVSEELITRQNDLVDGAIVAAGTEIIIPGARVIRVAPAAPVAVAGTQPTISSGSQAATFAAKPANTNLGTATAGKMIWPTKAPLVTQGYKYGHPALDIAYTSGDHTTGIHATMSGKVVIAQGGWNGGYGNMTVIDHGNGIQTRYAHQKEMYVSVGQYVSQGELIGWMGRTGRVYGRTGLHLHWEVIVNGRRVNPYQYL